MLFYEIETMMGLSHSNRCGTHITIRDNLSVLCTDFKAIDLYSFLFTCQRVKASIHFCNVCTAVSTESVLELGA